MKRLIVEFFLCLGLFAGSASAQAHKATATWTLSTDDTTTVCSATGNTCSQNSYRASGACSSSSVFTLLGALSATATTFTDTTIVPGTWCYAVTFVLNGKESLVFLSTDSNFATVSLQPAPQTGFAVVAQ